MPLRKSAGFAVVWNNHILLAHATGAPWHHTYSIIKGGIEPNEPAYFAAIREFEEETGHKLSKQLLKQVNANRPDFMEQNATKVLTGWFIRIENPEEIGLSTTTDKHGKEHTVFPKEQLQLEEIDWAGFVSFEEAEKRMAPYQLPILEKAKLLNANTVNMKIEKPYFSEEAQNFVPVHQLAITRQVENEGEETFRDVYEHINKIIATMPNTNSPDESTAYLHYFAGNSDWYIIQKDAGSKDDAPEDRGKQFQAYGIANINGAADYMNDGLGEYGYISIEELRHIARVELDFYFDPIRISDLKKEKQGQTEEPEPIVIDKLIDNPEEVEKRMYDKSQLPRLEDITLPHESKSIADVKRNQIKLIEHDKANFNVAYDSLARAIEKGNTGAGTHAGYLEYNLMVALLKAGFSVDVFTKELNRSNELLVERNGITGIIDNYAENAWSTKRVGDDSAKQFFPLATDVNQQEVIDFLVAESKKIIA